MDDVSGVPEGSVVAAHDVQELERRRAEQLARDYEIARGRHITILS